MNAIEEHWAVHVRQTDDDDNKEVETGDVGRTNIDDKKCVE